MYTIRSKERNETFVKLYSQTAKIMFDSGDCLILRYEKQPQDICTEDRPNRDNGWLI